jgi:hypothetical protein
LSDLVMLFIPAWISASKEKDKVVVNVVCPKEDTDFVFLVDIGMVEVVSRFPVEDEEFLGVLKMELVSVLNGEVRLKFPIVGSETFIMVPIDFLK